MSLVIHITSSNVERSPGACGGQNVHDANFLTPFDDSLRPGGVEREVAEGCARMHGRCPAVPSARQLNLRQQPNNSQRFCVECFYTHYY